MPIFTAVNSEVVGICVTCCVTVQSVGRSIALDNEGIVSLLLLLAYVANGDASVACFETLVHPHGSAKPLKLAKRWRYLDDGHVKYCRAADSLHGAFLILSV